MISEAMTSRYPAQETRHAKSAIATIFCAFLFLELAAQCPTNVCGYWYSENYSCMGTEPPLEYFSLDYVGDELVCTKVLGDPCVPAGHVTWQGIPEACTFSASLYVSSGIGMPIVTMGVQITVFSEDHFLLAWGQGDINYYRSSIEHLDLVGVDYSPFPVSCIECSSFVPNVFTPNGDGINDFLETTCGGEVARFSVTNRWGHVVYEVVGTEPSWDGRDKWDPCADGVYFWSMIDAGDHSGKLRHGVVHLLR